MKDMLIYTCLAIQARSEALDLTLEKEYIIAYAVSIVSRWPLHQNSLSW